MTQKITFRGEDPREHKARVRAAQQSSANEYISGLETGTRFRGDAVKARRTHYGDSRVRPQDLEFASNFSQSDAPGNAPLDDPINQTGDLTNQTSATRQANRDQDALAVEKAEERIAKRMNLYAGLMPGNASLGNNDRAATGRLG